VLDPDISGDHPCHSYALVTAWILGIGSDILWTERMRRSLRRFGPGYLEEVFSYEELQASPCFGDPAEFYASAKALGTGIDENVDWYDIQVIQAPGSTRLVLHEGARRHLLSKIPPNGSSIIHSKATSKKDIACALVIIEIIEL